MSTYSLAELTDRMRGKSITRSWDALVFMNRAKVNSLLEQQYITRFNKDSFLKRISGAPTMTPDGKEYLELGGLILSHPRLSFEKASLRNSRVTATKAIYSINVRGVDVNSDLKEILIGMFEEYPPGSGNAHCQLTRPPRL